MIEKKEKKMSGKDLAVSIKEVNFALAIARERTAP